MSNLKGLRKDLQVVVLIFNELKLSLKWAVLLQISIYYYLFEIRCKPILIIFLMILSYLIFANHF